MISLETTGLIGILTAGIVQLLKWLPQVPLVAGQTAKIRTVAAALAFTGNLGTALVEGNADALSVIAGSLASFLVSFLVFHGVIADPNKPKATPQE